jgi:diguanylate cyclase (GGDEF)-like protein/PAS domain S-box-containing protein
MRPGFHTNLALRAGTLIALGAMLLTALLSYFFFNRSYQGELLVAEKQLQQLVGTVENSAAIAAYLDNRELAAEVTHGLVKNDIVAGVVLVTENGMRANSGETLLESELAQRNRAALYHFPLAAPFEPTERVGEIIIKTNWALVKSNAEQAAGIHVLSMLLHSLAIVGLVIFLVYRLLTRPLKSLADELHTIEPGSDRRLQPLRGHKNDEIGQLVEDTNLLLDSVQATLDRERSLRLEVESLHQRFRLIFENASGGIVLSDQEGRLQLFNAAFERIVGEQRLERLMRGEYLPDLFDDAQAVRDALQEAPHSKAPIALDLHLAVSESHPACWLHGLFSSVHDETGGLLIEWIVYDVSERARREQQTLFEAERDPLTLLFNRRAGMRRVSEALDRVRAGGRHCALLMIDLDRFKPINDLYGHEAGDNVLIEVARRLRDGVRHDDIVIRWGGDEFVVLVMQGHGDFEAVTVANKILSGLSQDIDLGGGRHERIGASIGISLFPEHGETTDDLLEQADSAMYLAKEGGRNCFVVQGDDRVGLEEDVTPGKK